MTHEPAGRRYSSPLRERQREETRRTIVESVAALVAEGAIHTFTVQDVARRAGISYATVYRHFPTRESLLEGTYEWANELARLRSPSSPTRLEELPAWIERSMPIFEEGREISRAVLVIMGALNIQPPSRRERDRAVEGLVRAELPGFGADRVRQAAAVLRLLAGSDAWATLRDRFGLDEADTAAALTWALEALIRDLRREQGDRAPERSERGGPE
jgi:AcrR family transcriptional regulator